MNQALGWTLLHFVWEGAAVALLLAAVLPAVRTARVRYGAACLAMLAMAAVFAVTLWVEWPARAVAAPDQRFEITQPVLRAAPEGDGRFSRGGPPAWVAEIWIAGVLLLAFRRIAGWHATRRLRVVGTCVAPSPWPERLAQLCGRLGIGRRVALLESCLTDVPLVVGYLRPVILLPAGLLAGLPAEQLEYILLHELAHIARHDYLVNLLQSALEALLFYHPAVWWVSSVIRAERENCCDDVVVVVNGDARGYAAALVRIEESRAPEPTLGANGGSLSRRVRRLLGREQSYGLAGPVLAAVAVLLIAGISLRGHPQPQKPVQRIPEAEVGSHFAPVAAEPAPQDAQEQRRAKILARGEPTPYEKWLREDVAYIITDQERTAFKQLQTDEEREHFIEQFWMRRDPTPGTPENEMKEEHYRRIGYTNEHFAAGIPGWKTDRGRVYITYGPPDEIEDHSKNTPPFQQWRYRFIDGIGENVIVEFAGPEYRMTPDRSGVATLTASAASVFRSSKDRVTVTVRPNRSTTIDIVLDPAFRPITIYGQIDGPSTPQGPIRDIFQSSALEGKTYRHAVTLPPGSYVLQVRMRNLNGEAAADSVPFTVK